MLLFFIFLKLKVKKFSKHGIYMFKNIGFCLDVAKKLIIEAAERQRERVKNRMQLIIIYKAVSSSGKLPSRADDFFYLSRATGLHIH
jgi:hypothetical protein